MYNQAFQADIQKRLAQIEAEGLWKKEHIMTSAQSSEVTVDHRKVLNLCSNNYLGLANNKELIAAAKKTMDDFGFGLSSVRFICGTQSLHKDLEAKIAAFLGMEDAILYSSCFDANGGLFETVLGEDDAIISDELNHASIIDGIRLSKAKRFRYKNNNMEDLDHKLQAAKDCRWKMIATDGVFSMDGIIANLSRICDLAEKHQALVMVDDSHAVGFIGKKGRGTHEHCQVMQRVDIITGTLGKALGGASGGYVAGRKEIISLLRQRSRPYLFSNTLAPAIAGASLAVLDLLERSDDLREQLRKNSSHFREKMQAAGFQLVPGEHPIIPIMLGDAKLAQEFAARMLQRGVYVVGFFYPVVPLGKARIRTQMSAALTREQLDRAIAAFIEVGKELKVISA